MAKSYFNNGNDKNFKKDYRKRSTHQPNGLPKNLRVELPISCYGYTLDGKSYNGDTFVSLMEELQAHDTFNKISIPIYGKIEVVTKVGKHITTNKIIGYIRSFDPQTTLATCIIYTKNIEHFESIVKPMIVPRVAIKDDDCSCILGLDVVSEAEGRGPKHVTKD